MPPDKDKRVGQETYGREHYQVPSPFVSEEEGGQQKE